MLHMLCNFKYYSIHDSHTISLVEQASKHTTPDTKFMFFFAENNIISCDKILDMNAKYTSLSLYFPLFWMTMYIAVTVTASRRYCLALPELVMVIAWTTSIQHASIPLAMGKITIPLHNHFTYTYSSSGVEFCHSHVWCWYEWNEKFFREKVKMRRALPMTVEKKSRNDI